MLYIVIVQLFQRSEKIANRFSKMCLCTHKLLQVLVTKTILPFLRKGEKTSELVFFNFIKDIEEFFKRGVAEKKRLK